MVSEVNPGVLFDCTVPCGPFETEGTGRTEVIVRHGRERQVKIRRPYPGPKASARGEGKKEDSTDSSEPSIHGRVLPNTARRISPTTHPFLHPRNTLTLSLLSILTMEK